MLPVIRQEFIPRKWPLYFVGLIFIFLLFILTGTGKLQDVDSLPVIIGLAVFLFLYFMLSKNKLIIDNDEISQQLFFGKQKVLKWNEIRSSHLNWHYHGHSADLSWEFIDFSGKKISIQTSSYSRKNIRLIAGVLVEKSPQAVLDERIQKIASGIFPWYIF